MRSGAEGQGALRSRRCVVRGFQQQAVEKPPVMSVKADADSPKAVKVCWADRRCTPLSLEILRPRKYCCGRDMQGSNSEQKN